MNHSKRLVVLAIVGLFASSAATPALAMNTIAAEEATATRSVNVLQAFDHAVRIEEAVKIASRSANAVVAVRVENPGISSEFWPMEDFDANDYLAWFKELYGTEPQAVGLVVSVPAVIEMYTLSNGDRSEVLTPTAQFKNEVITTGAPEFVAPAPDGGTAWEFFKAPEEEYVPEVSALAAPGTADPAAVGVSPFYYTWRPTTIETRFENVAGRYYVSTYAGWNNGATPTVRPQKTPSGTTAVLDYGMEFSFDLYDGHAALPLRPVCGSAYDFLTSNNTFTWGVTTGSTALTTTVQAYKDDFDDGDSCSKESMSIGIKKPWLIPAFSTGRYSILASINAPVVTPTTNTAGGNVQLVDDWACQLFPSTAYTNCMGDSLEEPVGIPAYRISLNPDRNWMIFPHSLCFYSPDYGAKVGLSIPFDPDGCI